MLRTAADIAVLGFFSFRTAPWIVSRLCRWGKR